MAKNLLCIRAMNRISRRRIGLSFLLVTFSCSAYLACGGDDSTSIPNTEAGVDGSLAEASDLDTSMATDSGGSDSASDSPSSVDAADAGDATIATDGGAITDSGPGGDGAAISCGSATCNLPAQTCCVYKEVSPPFVVGCSNGTNCPAPPPDAGDGGVVSLGCELGANCNGSAVCCIEHNTNTGTIVSACKSSCAGSATVVSAEMCDPTAADAGCAQDAGACSSTNIGTWNLPNGFATCGGKLAN